MLADLYAQRGRYDDAAWNYEMLLERQPTHYDVRALPAGASHTSHTYVYDMHDFCTCS